MDTKTANTLWPNRDVLLVCEDTNYYNMIREILRQLKWVVHIPATDAQTARDRQLSKTFGATVVIESRKIQATELLRVLFQSDRGRLTPTLVLTNFSEPFDIQIFQKIFNAVVISKPLIPMKFLSAFKDMITHWEKPAMFALRHIANMSAEMNSEKAKISVLEKLASDTNAAPIAMQAITLLLSQMNQYREAEKKLLEYFRAAPKNPATLAQCAWFYLDSRAPHYALKFLSKLKQIAPSSVLLNLDIAIGHIACGHIDQALQALQEWNNYFPGNPIVESYIARLMIAEGFGLKDQTYGVPRAIVKRTMDAWQAFDPVPLKSHPDESQGEKVS